MQGKFSGLAYFDFLDLMMHNAKSHMWYLFEILGFQMSNPLSHRQQKQTPRPLPFRILRDRLSDFNVKGQKN